MPVMVVCGIALTLLAGLSSGCCMLPMKFARRWQWENIWLVFSIVSLFILPWGLALIVMGLAGVAGKILSKVFHHMGLGCLDRLAGAAFGFFQGALLVTVVILATLAFFPKAHWLKEAQLPRYFFGACHLSTEMSPADLSARVRRELKALKDESPEWVHPDSGTL